MWEHATISSGYHLMQPQPWLRPAGLMCTATQGLQPVKLCAAQLHCAPQVCPTHLGFSIGQRRPCVLNSLAGSRHAPGQRCCAPAGLLQTCLGLLASLGYAFRLYRCGSMGHRWVSAPACCLWPLDSPPAVLALVLMSVHVRSLSVAVPVGSYQGLGVWAPDSSATEAFLAPGCVT